MPGVSREPKKIFTKLFITADTVSHSLLQTYISMTYLYMGSSLLLGIMTYISVYGSLQAQAYRYICLCNVYIRHRQIEPISKVGLSTSKKDGFIYFNESFL